MTTAQRVSFWSSVALFAFVIVGRLLWGAALGEHGGAWLDVGRDAVLAKEPTAIRIRAVERTLGAARQEVGEVAEAIGAATAERDTVVRQLAQFVHSEKEDRELLAQLHDSLADLDSRGVTTVTIGRDAFTKSDLEHERKFQNPDLPSLPSRFSRETCPHCLT